MAKKYTYFYPDNKALGDQLYLGELNLLYNIMICQGMNYSKNYIKCVLNGSRTNQQILDFVSQYILHRNTFKANINN